MANNEAITRFVRETLGCKCPDEVFRHIEFTQQPEGCAIQYTKITIGGRLLIYLYQTVHTEADLDKKLEELLGRGREERDSSGLNRFRLVIAADEPGSIKETLIDKFESLRGSDEKLHLHVISRSDPRL
jgi:hypothetical protein